MSPNHTYLVSRSTAPATARAAQLVVPSTEPGITPCQVRGYTGRYITYTGPDFKEGLSLSIHDEISRMRKYAFGCSELVFNPLSRWLYRCATALCCYVRHSCLDPECFIPVHVPGLSKC